MDKSAAAESGAPDGAPHSAAPGADTGASAHYQWGPDRRLTAVTVAMLVGGLAWLALDHTAENRVVAAMIALVGLATTVALLRVRVRLAADAGGLTIRGPLHIRAVPWQQVTAIATPTRSRFGRRAASLEIDIDDDVSGDAHDTTLIVFARLELGEDPAEVGRILRSIRPGRSR